VLNDEVSTAVKERWKRHKSSRVWLSTSWFSFAQQHITKKCREIGILVGEMVINDDQ
jgi:hypothetical protein